MSGLLAELYSTIDSQKRKLKGLLDDPVETIRQGLLNFRDDQNAALTNNGVAYQLPGYQSVLLQKSQIDAAKKKSADDAANMAFSATFIGPNAKTWDALSAKKAQEMAAQGVDPRRIWSETGNWKGPDGNWRQEIPDNKLTTKTNPLPTVEIGGKKYESFNLSDAINHDALFNAYPDTANITGSFRQNGRDGASYNGALDSIQFDSLYRQGIPSAEQIAASIAADEELSAFTKNTRHRRLNALLDANLDNESEFNRIFNKYGGKQDEKTDSILSRNSLDARAAMRENPAGGAYLGNTNHMDSAVSTTAHELQHAIQQREGWARGGSPEQMGLLRKDYIDEKNFLTNTDEYQTANKRMYELLNNPDKYNKEGLERGAYVKKVVDWFSSQPVVRRVEELTPIPADSTKAYRLLAGEAEARATQARIPLDAAQRRALFPEDSYDVPMNQLIIRGLLN